MGVFLIVDLLLVLLCHQLRAAQARADAATAAQREADRQVAEVLAAVTDCFCAVDGQWRFTYVNPQAEAYFGRTRAELIGRDHWEVLHPRCRDAAGAGAPPGDGRAAEPGVRAAVGPAPRPVGRGAGVSGGTGSVGWRRHGRRRRAGGAGDAARAAGGMSIYFRDVTERHDAAERLAASERQLRLITDAAPVFISYIDSSGVYRFNNRRYAEWFGVPREQITGRTVADVMGPANYEAAKGPLTAALAGEHVVYERFHRDHAGVERWMKAEYVPDRDEQGRVRGLVCVVVDETDRRRALEEARRSEESYRSFITHSTEGIWRFELDQPIPTDAPVGDQIDAFYAHAYLAECNDAMARMYGFASADELSGARLGDLLPRTDPHNVEYLAAFVRAGYRLADAESHELDRDGNEKVFVNNLTGIVENGRLVRAWGTQRDATEQKRAEEASATARPTTGRSSRCPPAARPRWTRGPPVRPRQPQDVRDQRLLGGRAARDDLFRPDAPGRTGARPGLVPGAARKRADRVADGQRTSARTGRRSGSTWRGRSSATRRVGRCGRSASSAR